MRRRKDCRCRGYSTLLTKPYATFATRSFAAASSRDNLRKADATWASTSSRLATRSRTPPHARGARPGKATRRAHREDRVARATSTRQARSDCGAPSPTWTSRFARGRCPHRRCEGSGKSTLVKLLTGLYAPDGGEIVADAAVVDDATRGAYRQRLSPVFSDWFLFDRRFGLQCARTDDVALRYLKELRLDAKVKVEQGRFSTTELSLGQRMRLMLLMAAKSRSRNSGRPRDWPSRRVSPRDEYKVQLPGTELVANNEPRATRIPCPAPGRSTPRGDWSSETMRSPSSFVRRAD